MNNSQPNFGWEFFYRSIALHTANALSIASPSASIRINLQLKIEIILKQAHPYRIVN
ncbi:MAG: hypothetical protein MUE44_07975 [Oscillatoriaceae cyanobacterium Prado104]|nr:hypothetical protein [Oscillatoriaceae cyanobacterium Prado104]